jgi:hypothetical protein
MTGQINKLTDGYADKLTKLLPAEGIAALTTIYSLMSGKSENTPALEGAAFIIGVFVFLWAREARQVRSPVQLIFILLAYLLWSVNILWPVLRVSHAWAGQSPQMSAPVLAILFALFIPFVFPPAQPATPVQPVPPGQQDAAPQEPAPQKAAPQEPLPEEGKE